MSIKDYQAAALRLVKNLTDQLDPEDARNFAAFVLAKLSHDANIPIRESLEETTRQWADLMLTQLGRKELDGGNCTCLARCAVQNTPDGPLVVHAGMACMEFRDRFPMGAPTRARDHMGWCNYASEKQGQEGESGTKPDRPEDEASKRFSLLELS